MSVNAQAQVMLDMMAGVDMDTDHVSVEEMRALTEVEPTGNPEVAKVEDRTVNLAGNDIPLRIFTPEGAGPHALMVYFHGGGWVFGGLDSHDSTCRMLCNEGSCVVVSVDYRMAPEDKYPAASDDSYAATVWAAENAESLGADANKLVVAGDSAGGNLATVVALMARDKIKAGESAPDIKFQVPIYPVTDYRADSASFEENAEGYYLTAKMMRWFWAHYLANESDGKQPYASPVFADLTGLPPALVITAEYDPLRDEGEAYAQKLLEAGVRTELIRYAGQIHGFVGMYELIDDGRNALQTIGAKVKQALA